VAQRVESGIPVSDGDPGPTESSAAAFRLRSMQAGASSTPNSTDTASRASCSRRAEGRAGSRGYPMTGAAERGAERAGGPPSGPADAAGTAARGMSDAFGSGGGLAEMAE
jgi:hypothetical protein